jgi:DNA-binding response OmpR family regulator
MSGDDCGMEKNSIGDDFLAKPFDFNELISKVHHQVAYA